MVYVVGNLTKDVYLKLLLGELPTDEAGVPWLDLPFDGGEHRYVRRTAVHSGLAVALEVARKFGLSASYIDQPAHHRDYRYLLSTADAVAVFTPQTLLDTLWQVPAKVPEAIWLDYSAHLSGRVRAEIERYLDEHPEVKLCGWAGLFAPDNWKRRFSLRAVTDEAEFETTDGDCEVLCANKSVVMVRTGGQVLSEVVENSQIGLLPLDTVATVASVGYYAAVARGYEPAVALKLAAGAVANTTLAMTPSLEWLVENLEEVKVAEPVSEALSVQEVARRLMASGKGILAADESGGSIKKKFGAAGIPDDFPHRHDYRKIFLEAKGLDEYLTGVIMFDETARDRATDGTLYPDSLWAAGIIPGIKVDAGKVDFGDGEMVTEGLDGLDERLAEYRKLGLRFAKWRAEYVVGDGRPSDALITENSRRLAEYARLCQKNDIVPIVEPEVVYDGDYSLEAAIRALVRVLEGLFKATTALGVDNSAMILKTNMVLAGKQFKKPTAAATVGKATALVLRSTVPKDLAGVVFLSGGQSSEQATENLHAVVKNGPYAWPVTFSFARALQDPALEVWQGDNANTAAARRAFMKQLKKTVVAQGR